MRRRKISGWESDARAAVERVREVFASLNAMRREVTEGTCSQERWARTYASIEEEHRRLTRWLLEWGNTARAGKKDEVALAIFSTCLPPLVNSVRVFNDALALIMLSPVGNGREIAGTSLAAAEKVAQSAFVLLEDNRALRGRGLDAVRRALGSFERNAARLRILGPQVHKLVEERVNKKPKVLP